MDHNNEMKKVEDHEGQTYFNFATVPNSETRFEQEYYRTGRDSVGLGDQVVAPTRYQIISEEAMRDVRVKFFDSEGWYAPDDHILDWWFGKDEKEEEPELTYAEHVEAKEKQVGGDHYKNMTITPREYNKANNLGWDEGNVVKYISRHGTKNGREDVEKALHYCELLLEEYDRQEANLS